MRAAIATDGGEHQDAPQFHAPRHGSVHCASSCRWPSALGFRVAQSAGSIQEPRCTKRRSASPGLSRLRAVCICEAHVHTNEQREHGRASDDGPSQKEPEHHEMKPTYCGSGRTRVRVTASLMFLLGRIEDAPGGRDRREPPMTKAKLERWNDAKCGLASSRRASRKDARHGENQSTPCPVSIDVAEADDNDGHPLAAARGHPLEHAFEGQLDTR